MTDRWHPRGKWPRADPNGYSVDSKGRPASWRITRLADKPLDCPTSSPLTQATRGTKAAAVARQAKPISKAAHIPLNELGVSRLWRHSWLGLAKGSKWLLDKPVRAFVFIYATIGIYGWYHHNKAHGAHHQTFREFH